MNWSRRLSEWWQVIQLERAEGRRIPWLKMLWAAVEGPVPRKVWFHRMMICYRCPLHNRQLSRINTYGKTGDTYRGQPIMGYPVSKLIWSGIRQCRSPHPSYQNMGCGCDTNLKSLSARPYEFGCWGFTLAQDHPEVGPLGWPAHEWGSLWQQGRDLIGHFRRRRR